MYSKYSEITNLLAYRDTVVVVVVGEGGRLFHRDVVKTIFCAW